MTARDADAAMSLTTFVRNTVFGIGSLSSFRRMSDRARAQGQAAFLRKYGTTLSIRS